MRSANPAQNLFGGQNPASAQAGQQGSESAPQQAGYENAGYDDGGDFGFDDGGGDSYDV